MVVGERGWVGLEARGGEAEERGEAVRQRREGLSTCFLPFSGVLLVFIFQIFLTKMKINS